MSKACAWLIASAVLATAGVAQAQETAPSVRNADQAELPWYQRFTTSTGLTETMTGPGETGQSLSPSWNLNQRWGVTVDLREAPQIDRAPDAIRRQDETAVGAYYQFTPRVRVGGEVSVSAAQRDPSPSGRTDDEREPSAGVRLESAFRF